MTRRKSRKIFGVILILLSLIVAMIPTGESVAEDDSKSKLSDFQLSGTTLIRYTGTAETVSVPDSVKVIADEAFANNSYMILLRKLFKVILSNLRGFVKRKPKCKSLNHFLYVITLIP